MTTQNKGGSGSHNKHARLSPSASERWMTCTAAIEYVERLREAGLIPKVEPKNIYGEMGTYAHDLAERALNHLLGVKEDAEIKKHKSIHRWLDSHSHLEQKSYAELESYIDHCMTSIRHKKDRVYVEVQSPLFYSKDPDEQGTCDFLILHRDGDVTIRDLKWRRSGMVESHRNSQLAIYAMSYISNRMFRKLDPKAEISLGTFNPLVSPYVEPWDISVAEFRRFCKEIQTAAEIVEEGLFTFFVPSETACKWCPAREVCAPRAMKMIHAMPSTIMSDGVFTMDEESLVEFYRLKGELDAMMKSVETRLFELAEKGTPAPGTKLTIGRSNRRYKDEDKAASFLLKYLDRDEVFKNSLNPFSGLLPKLSKSAQATFEKNHLFKPPGSPKLVLEESKGASISTLKTKLFANLRRK